MHLRTFCLLLAFGFIGPQDAWAAEFWQESDHTIYMTGQIAEGDFDRLKRVWNQRITKQRVKSVGGEVIAAIKIAEFIRAKKLDLEVDRICLSSCANYLFVAAQHKTIPENGMLGFHGAAVSSGFDIASGIRKRGKTDGLSRTEMSAEIRRDVAYHYRWLAAEGSLYVKLGVSRRLLSDWIYVAQGEVMDLATDKYADSASPPVPMWWPSAKLLRERYGVRRVRDAGRPVLLETQGYVVDSTGQLLLIGDKDLPDPPSSVASQARQ